MNDKVIYTVLTNGYAELRIPKVRSIGYDYVCFTDDSDLTSNFWQIRVVPKGDVKLQRKIKILAHKYLPEYRITCYTDASQQLKRDVNNLAFKGGILLKKHPHRDCIYQEADRVINLNKDIPEVVLPQIEDYKAWGHPEHWGLYETGFMMRENTEKVNTLCEAWWRHVDLYSHRDQISLPVVIRQMGIEPAVINPRVINTYFFSFRHKLKRAPRSTKVWYSTPFSIEKNMGKAYNEFCSMVPDDDWICLRDGDTMFLRPNWGKQIADIIRIHGNDYDLFGCVTNRLNSENQRPFPQDFDETDILYHKKRADQLYMEHGYHVSDHGQPIAGLLMLFPKRIWKRIRFKENDIYFDTAFGKELLANGGRIGLMKGLYVLHFYRWNQKNPAKHKEHLKA